MFSYSLELHAFYLLFFFNDTATTEIYTLSLHDALPIFVQRHVEAGAAVEHQAVRGRAHVVVHELDGQAAATEVQDRKSTRLNSSHVAISYAVFCLKKKTKKENVQ